MHQRIKGRLEQGFYSEFRGYGLRRDLAKPLEKPQAKIPLYIRPLRIKDLDILLPVETDLEISEKRQIAWRRHFYKKMPDGCMVAIDGRNDVPCYMQWLLGSRENSQLARFRCFPRLGKDEALLEQAYTLPSHRGLGIMSAAMAEIADCASSFGAKYVLTFVDEKGTASLKACQRAGFTPYLQHRRTQMGYGAFVHNSFEKLNVSSF